MNGQYQTTEVQIKTLEQFHALFETKPRAAFYILARANQCLLHTVDYLPNTDSYYITNDSACTTRRLRSRISTYPA